MPGILRCTSRRSTATGGSVLLRRQEPAPRAPTEEADTLAPFPVVQAHKALWKQATSVCITVGKYETDDYKSTALHVRVCGGGLLGRLIMISRVGPRAPRRCRVGHLAALAASVVSSVPL